MALAVLTELLDLVRCPDDGGALVSEAHSDSNSIRVVCVDCRATFRYEHRVLDLMGGAAPIEDESRYELEVREREATISRGHPSFRPSWQDETELASIVRALGDIRGRTIVELGSGPGFFTQALVQAGACVVGVDFSREALRVNADQLPAEAPVLLIRADVGRVRFAPRVFDAGTCSLYSNLPTEALRCTANATVAASLKPGARYWVGAHHQNLRRRLRARPAADRYPGSRIFFQNFTSRALSSELGRHFTHVGVTGLSIWVPLISRIPLLQRWINERGGRVVWLRGLGYLLLAEAFNERPSRVDTR